MDRTLDEVDEMAELPASVVPTGNDQGAASASTP
jgi:hypothetical protein